MTSQHMAQEVFMCDKCNVSPVQRYCNKCDASLCNECVLKHILADDTKSHEIVIYELKNEDPKFPDCETHAKQQCEMHCKECDIPVCVKCIIAGTHHNHHFTDMLEIFNFEKEKILRETTELETFIYPTVQDAISELQTKLDELPKNHEELMTSISQQGVEWHRQIDVIINKRKKEAEKTKTEIESALQKLLSDMKKLLSAIHQAVLENKDLMKSKELKKMKTYKSKITEFKKSSSKFDVTPPTFTSGPISTKKLDEMFGSLESFSITPYAHIKMTEVATSPSKQQLVDSRKVGSDINTGYNELFSIASHGYDEIWVTGNNNNIKRFNNQGLLQQTVTTTTGNVPGGITVTRKGELIYTDWKDSSIYIVKNGKIEKMITVQDWKPGKVCYTASGDLLVSMSKDDKTSKKVVRYSGSTEKQVIEFGQDGKPWFSTGSLSLFIDENRNGDLCVSDRIAKQVVVINQSGILQLRYTGNLPSNKYKSFYPHGIVIDSEGHILIADHNNHGVHIISENGHFIRFIDNCQLITPYDLSLDENNTLYVTERNNAKVKMIEYMK